MPKRQLLPEYETDQMIELIRQRIHNEDYQKMLYLRLIKGWTFEKISFKLKYTPKTVRKHIHECEEILFKHFPG